MDKYRPCPSIFAMFTSDSQHPPRSRHAVYLGEDCMSQVIMILVLYVTSNNDPGTICHNNDLGTVCRK